LSLEENESPEIEESEDLQTEVEDSEENTSINPDQFDQESKINPVNFKANFSQTDLSFIAGKRRSGKTNLIIYLIELFTSLGANIIIVDPVWDIGQALQKLHGKKDPRIVNIGYQDRAKFNIFLRNLFKKKWKGILIIDEADGFFPNKKGLSSVEKFFIHIGRHYGVGGICVTRRMANMNTDIATQANKMIIFKHWHRADLDYLSQSGIVEEIPIIRKLSKHHFQFLDIDGEVSATCKPVQKML